MDYSAVVEGSTWVIGGFALLYSTYVNSRIKNIKETSDKEIGGINDEIHDNTERIRALEIIIPALSEKYVLKTDFKTEVGGLEKKIIDHLVRIEHKLDRKADKA